jgi:uncharacterized protein YegP (UPF0339 family)
MTDHDDTPGRPGQHLADELELAGAGMTDVSPTDLAHAGRIIRQAGALIDAIGLAGIAETRGLDAVLAELADDIAAQHDPDEVDLPPAAELLEVIEDRPRLALVPDGPPWPTDEYRVDLDRGRLRAEVYADHAGKHRWRVVHTMNGETMASGEGYADTRDRDHAVALLFPGVTVVELDAPPHPPPLVVGSAEEVDLRERFLAAQAERPTVID